MKKKFPEIFILIGGIFFLDLLSKWLAVNFLGNLTVKNQGIAWGMFLPRYFIIFASVIFIGIFWRMFKKGELEFWPTGLIVGGALGNLTERLFFGQVTDFISIGSFPSFNLADSAITIGVLLLLFAKNGKK